jgi:acetate kinase
VDRAAAAIAAAATRLPRLDGLVMTGGIGEASSVVRAAIVARLGVLGLAPLAALGDADPIADAIVSDGGVPVLRVAAREDRIIAAAVRAMAAG